MIVFLDSVEKAVLLLVWGRVLSVLLGAAEHDIDTAQWRVVLAIVTLGGFIFDSFFLHLFFCFFLALLRVQIRAPREDVEEKLAARKKSNGGVRGRAR